MIWLYLLAHFICGVISYGMSFAYLQGRYRAIAKEDYREDMAFSVFTGLWGPLGLFITCFLTGFAKHGLKFK